MLATESHSLRLYLSDLETYLNCRRIQYVHGRVLKNPSVVQAGNKLTAVSSFFLPKCFTQTIKQLSRNVHFLQLCDIDAVSPRLACFRRCRWYLYPALCALYLCIALGFIDAIHS